jgi:hypothetical protein
VSKRSEFVEAAKEAGLEVEPVVPTENGEPIDDALKANNPAAEIPKPVRDDGQMLASYVLPHYRLGKGDERFVEMQFSFPLTKDHKGLLPRGVETAWKQCSKQFPSIKVNEIPPQTFTVRLYPEQKKKGAKDEYELHLVGAMIVQAQVKLVDVKGKGSVQTVKRFSFRVIANAEVEEMPDGSNVAKDVRKFADTKYGKDLWIEIAATQASLLKDRDESEE